jgi:K+-transporting ATPase KdpF subunit
MTVLFITDFIGLSGLLPAIEYITGAIIALVILGYLVYALLKPEKF